MKNNMAALCGVRHQFTVYSYNTAEAAYRKPPRCLLRQLQLCKAGRLSVPHQKQTQTVPKLMAEANTHTAAASTSEYRDTHLQRLPPKQPPRSIHTNGPPPKDEHYH